VILAVDISNWQGPLTTERIACLQARGVQHVVVRASLEDAARRALAQQQAGAVRAAGLGLSVYVWVYFTRDAPGALVAAATDLMEGFQPARYWLDVEDVEHAYPAPAANAAWLRAALQAFQDRGIPAGIYTGRWYWVPYLGNTEEFAGWPLWVAQWDQVPDVTVWQPFGGWQQPAGKQYAGGEACGMQVDWNVFVPEAVAERAAEADPDTAALLEWAHAVAGELPRWADALAQARRGRSWRAVRAVEATIRRLAGEPE
jgi:hypothetical protein